MTHSQPEPLEPRVSNLEMGMSDLRATAEALLQVVQIHQGNFETITVEMQSLRRQQLESDQRFEILLAELRQLKIDSDRRFEEQRTQFEEHKARFDEQQAEIRKLLQHPFYQSDDADAG